MAKTMKGDLTAQGLPEQQTPRKTWRAALAALRPPRSSLNSIMAVGLAMLFMLQLVGTAPALPATGTLITTVTDLGEENLSASNPCPAGIDRYYDVVTLRLPVSYNNWGDFDPEGRIYVPMEHLEELVEDVALKLSASGMQPFTHALDRATEALLAQPAAPLPSLPNALQQANTLYDQAVTMLQSGAFSGNEGLGPFLPSDLVRPYLPRAYLGECVQFNLTNALPEPASLKINTLQTIPGHGMALGNEEPDVTFPGETRAYIVYIPPHHNMEGAHFLQSGADPRFHTKHGLFGALVAHPPGTSFYAQDGTIDIYADQGFTQDLRTSNEGQQASDWREFVMFYHDEAELWSRDGPLPIIDPYGAYGPGTKAINLRSEPFMKRFEMHDALRDAGELPRGADKSMSYSSYTYGDPPTYVPKSYLGDPVKWRVLNAGPGQHHVHHLHGGGIRWAASPVAGNTQFDIAKDEAVKVNPDIQAPSERLDIQNIGPGESFNMIPEGGSGGVQRSAGEFLFHCHIVEHYVAGMWGFWRTFNTLQRDDAGEIWLAELPDRLGRTPDAVNSLGLLGADVPGFGDITEDNIELWVESQLPAQGVPRDNDASVWDWIKQDTDQGTLYFGEPETAIVWANYPSDAMGRLPAGERPEILFHPEDGRLAYPLLRPQFGERPPLPPDNSPAPYLDTGASGIPEEDAALQASRGDILCPPDLRPDQHRQYQVSAITTELEYGPNVAGKAEIYTLFDDKEDVLTGNKEAKSLILRANQGDCVDVTYVNELDPRGSDLLPKTNMHIHLVQFDVQSSDGVVAGFHYEQSLLPLDQTGVAADRQTVTRASGQATVIGEGTVIPVDNILVFLDANNDPKVGSTVGVALGRSDMLSARLVDADPATSTITLAGQLDVPADLEGLFVGYEFKNYRWYADVELGIVYWHDHVDGLVSWQRGLFGGIVIEPAEAQWCESSKRDGDGCNKLSPTAHVADVIAGENGEESFREIVLQVQDRVCTDDFCVDPIDPRPPLEIFRAAAFNTRSNPIMGLDFKEVNGSTVTDKLEAYAGDDVTIRFLYAGQAISRGTAVFGMTGHQFQFEQNLDGSRILDSISVGISSQHNLRMIGGAGGPCGFTGDYLYFMTGSEKIERGAWGIMRVHDPDEMSLLSDPALAPLPNNNGIQPTQQPEWCTDVGAREYDVSAIHTAIEIAPGVMRPTDLFVPSHEVPLIEQGLIEPRPLVLRALQGEAVKVNLENQLDRPVSLHASVLFAKPGDGLGITVGNNPDDSVAPGETRTYTWYTGDPNGPDVGAVHLQSFDDPVEDPKRGLYGSLVVLPADTDPESVTSWTGPSASYEWNGQTWHEHVLLYESDDPWFQGSIMPYFVDVKGHPMVNYRSDSLHDRVKPHPAFDEAAALLQEANGLNLPFVQSDVHRFGGMGLHSCHIDPQECGRFVPIGTMSALLEVVMILAGAPEPVREIVRDNNPIATDNQRVLFEARNPHNALAHRGLDPTTALIEGKVGDGLVIRSLVGAGDQPIVHHVAGHRWALDPHMDGCRDDLAECDSNIVSAVTLGPREVSNAWIVDAGAGGPGDYLWANQRGPFHEGGQWGLVRIHPETTEGPIY
jgi:manganese oxidase